MDKLHGEMDENNWRVYPNIATFFPLHMFIIPFHNQMCVMILLLCIEVCNVKKNRTFIL